MGETATYRSRSGRVLAIAAVVVAIAVIVSIAFSDGPSGVLHFGAIPLLFAAFVWAIFDRPYLRVTDGGLEIGNVFRSIHVPWPGVTDLELRWGLRVVTSFGKYTAWSVPAPKRPSIGSQFTGGLGLGPARSLDTSLVDNARKPGRNRTPSEGAAAAAQRWAELGDAGYLDQPRLDAARPTTSWNTDVIAICAVLIVLAAIGLATYG